jgi:sugar lactone lactonase YvrE
MGVAMSQARRARLLVAAILAVGFAGGVVLAQAGRGPLARPNPYAGVEGFFKLPDGRTIGGTAGIDIDRDGVSLWAFERCAADACDGSTLAPIMKFDATGKLVKNFGSGMFVNPHGIHVDRDGNVWVTDGQASAGRGNQVFKLSPDGEVLMRLGRAGAAAEGPDTFNRPSDVLVAPNGDIFVADGHGGETNARIVKFTRDGKFIKAWGRKGSGPGEFDTPHALVMDSQGRLFVGDRGNSRIQIFDQEGTFLAEWRQFGRPSGLFIDRNDVLYSADHQSTEATNPGGWQKGIWIGSARDGSVTAFIPDPDQQGGSQEGVAVDSGGNVFGSLTGGRALKKYVRKAGS